MTEERDWPGFRALDRFLVTVRLVGFVVLFYIVGWLALVLVYFVFTDPLAALVTALVGCFWVWRIVRRR